VGIHDCPKWRTGKRAYGQNEDLQEAKSEPWSAVDPAVCRRELKTVLTAPPRAIPTPRSFATNLYEPGPTGLPSNSFPLGSRSEKLRLAATRSPPPPLCSTWKPPGARLRGLQGARRRREKLEGAARGWKERADERRMEERLATRAMIRWRLKRVGYQKKSCRASDMADWVEKIVCGRRGQLEVETAISLPSVTGAWSVSADMVA
jgi:hypothetical protein